MNTHSPHPLRVLPKAMEQTKNRPIRNAVAVGMPKYVNARSLVKSVYQSIDWYNDVVEVGETIHHPSRHPVLLPSHPVHPFRPKSLWSNPWSPGVTSSHSSCVLEPIKSGGIPAQLGQFIPVKAQSQRVNQSSPGLYHGRSTSEVKWKLWSDTLYQSLHNSRM